MANIIMGIIKSATDRNSEVSCWETNDVGRFLTAGKKYLIKAHKFHVSVSKFKALNVIVYEVQQF